MLKEWFNQKEWNQFSIQIFHLDFKTSSKMSSLLSSKISSSVVLQHFLPSAGHKKNLPELNIVINNIVVVSQLLLLVSNIFILLSTCFSWQLKALLSISNPTIGQRGSKYLTPACFMPSMPLWFCLFRSWLKNIS